MDYEQLASEILRALRGRRSQPGFSKRLGYSSNVAYRWESGVTFPTAARSLKAARCVGVDVRARLKGFFNGLPQALTEVDPATPEGVAALLRAMVGITPIGELAKRSGRSRFSISRWLKGTAEPRLPELLLLVDAASQRLLDFVQVLVDPAKLATAATAWAELQAAKAAAYSTPWSHAVLRVLELAEYRALPRHRTGWIAKRLGLNSQEEARCLELLAASGQIRREDQRWVVEGARVVNTAACPLRSRQVKRWWTEVALERAERGYPHRASYAVFNLAEADVPKVVTLYEEFHSRLRTLVTESEPCERVLLLCNHLISLEAPSLTTPTLFAADQPKPRRNLLGRRSNQRFETPRPLRPRDWERT